MKIAVLGLWHLGTVTAACIAAAGNDVIAYDNQPETIAQLQKGQPPVFEPGLEELVQTGIKTNKLKFTNQLSDLAEAEIIWVTFDTPVDDDDHADTDFVMKQVESTFPYLKENSVVLISSQLPVGSVKKLQESYIKQYPTKKIGFACSPENLRLGKAIDVFTNPDRIVVGVQTEADRKQLESLLSQFSKNIVWMSVQSAEMTKHALNAFLATSVVFINELATLCENVGADAREVEQGLKSEIRIGPKAYLRPGSAFAGGTLARDIRYLIENGKQQNLPTQLFSAVLSSNHSHKQWSCRRLETVLGNLKDKVIAVLGLTYKAGTDTLRRSTAIETCQWLNQQGAKVVAYDPVVKNLSADLAKHINLKSTLAEALKDADAVVISTEWPEFTSLLAEEFVTHLKQPLVFDASGFLEKNLGNDKRIRYFSVGKSA